MNSPLYCLPCFKDKIVKELKHVDCKINNLAPGCFEHVDYWFNPKTSALFIRTNSLEFFVKGKEVIVKGIKGWQEMKSESGESAFLTIAHTLHERFIQENPEERCVHATSDI